MRAAAARVGRRRRRRPRPARRGASASSSASSRSRVLAARHERHPVAALGQPARQLRADPRRGAGDQAGRAVVRAAGAPLRRPPGRAGRPGAGRSGSGAAARASRPAESPRGDRRHAGAGVVEERAGAISSRYQSTVSRDRLVDRPGACSRARAWPSPTRSASPWTSARSPRPAAPTGSFIASRICATRAVCGGITSTGWWMAGDVGDVVDQLRPAHVLAAEDVALAGLALVGGQQVARGGVDDVGEVHRRVDHARAGGGAGSCRPCAWRSRPGWSRSTGTPSRYAGLTTTTSIPWRSPASSAASSPSCLESG